MKNRTTLLPALTTILVLSGCGVSVQKKPSPQEFIAAHVKKVKPMMIDSALANWKAANTGDPKDYDRFSKLQLKVRQVYSNPREFALVKEMKQSGQIQEALTVRQIELLHNSYLANQMEPKLLKKIVELGTEIEKNFSTFRGTIDGQKVTDNEIKEILKTETDSAERKKAWLASKQVGPVVAADIIRLVKLRNRAAHGVGFDNFHTLSLTASQQDVKELDKIFEELDKLTRKPFARLKADLDRTLAAMYGVDVTEIMPWHYHDPFFQTTPMVYDLNLDIYYEDTDVKELTVKFYDGIGLSVESILENSDLYEREGKNPHAFCTDIDREGDVRILCNIKNNEQWAETTLHELGHAVYSKYHDRGVPFLLRDAAHIFTTEAIAMFFGRLSGNAAWMQQMLDLSDHQRMEIEKVSRKYAQLKQLIFARWDLVMYNFEKELYRDPGQELNSLWWDMVEKYQLVKRPRGRHEPDWAAKIHFAIAPCYYHNYLLGELFASQLHNYIVKNILKLESDKGVSYVNQKRCGEFLRKKVFEPGAVYHWNEMIKRATGEKLTPKYFVAEFVN
jgi:peptidyl-dipeptidase A